MPTRLERVVDEHKEKFPHMKTYAECQSKAFMTGSLSFIGGSATVFVAQELLKAYLPYSRDKFLLLPIFVGTISAYVITQRQTRMCQDMWLAMEEKHSVLTPMEERLQEKAIEKQTKSP